MQITSPAFEESTMLPKAYTCDGQGVNPPLVFSEIPDDAKSLALVVEDPDAPNRTYTHWLLYNMLPNTNEIAEGSVPETGLQGKTSSGKPGYVAACPPSGSHRYIFTLFALDILLPEDESYDNRSFQYATQGHIVGTASLMGMYQRGAS